ncbi:MAG: hypothetical protein ACI92E_001598 [Oceanicoccus sp.]|jgi:hypothetical protein
MKWAERPLPNSLKFFCKTVEEPAGIITGETPRKASYETT